MQQLGRRTISALALAVTALLSQSAIGQLATGHVLEWRKLSAAPGETLAAYLDPGDGFGRSVAGIGDLDGDGVIDFAVGAPFDDDSGVDAGAVYILHMRLDGTIKQVRKIVDGTGGIDLQLSGGEEFGFAVAPCRDFNLDGTDDLIVGVPGARRVHVLYLEPSGAAISGETTVAAQVMDGSTLRYGEAVVQQIAPPTEHEGWGDFGWVPEETTFLCILATGAPPEEQAFWARLSITNGVHHFPDNNMMITGVSLCDRTRVLSVGSGHQLYYGDPVLQHLNGIQTKWDAHEPPAWNEKVKTTGHDHDDLQNHLNLPMTDEAGAAVAYVGDFLINDAANKLGMEARWTVGAPGTDGHRGAVHLLPNRDDGDDLLQWGNKAIGEIHLIAPGQSGFDATLNPGDRFGEALHGPGDLNQDGIGDVLVGAPGDSDGGAGAGAIWLVYLEPLNGTGLPGSFANSLAGRPGRGSVPPALLPTDSGSDYQDVFDDLLIVTPRFDGTTVHTSKIAGLPNEDVLFVPSGDFQSGDEPQQATFDHVNLDGFIDILAINRVGGGNGAGTLSFIPGLAGGTFDTSPHVTDLDPFNAFPIVVGTTDLDGDFLTDAVVGGDMGVTALFGTGGLGFPMSLTTSVDHVTDLALGDLDGDGDIDALSASGRVGTVGSEEGFLTPLINQGGVQAGTPGDLQAGTVFPAAQDTAVASVLLGHFDGDADLDALVAFHELDGGVGTPPQAELQLWLNDGSGVFTQGGWPGASFPHADRIHPTYGAVGDIDNDGDLDAVYLSADNIAYDASLFTGEFDKLEIVLLVNQGNAQAGTLGEFAVTTIGTEYSGLGLAPILADVYPLDVPNPGDVGDGNLDIVLVWYTDKKAGEGGTATDFETLFALLQGDGAGEFDVVDSTKEPTGHEPGGGDAGNGGPAPGLDSFLGAVLDPAALDIIVPNEADDSLSMLFGVGDGTLVPGPVTRRVDDYTPPAGLSGGPIDAHFATLNGDAHLDVVAYCQYDDLTGVDATVVGTLVTLLGDGTGSFTVAERTPLVNGGEYAIGDVTGSSSADLIVTQHRGAGAPSTLVVHPGAGDGTLDSALSAVAAPGGHVLTGGLVLGDVTGNGKLDAVVSSLDGTGEGHALVYEGTGAALSAPAAFAVLDNGGNPVSWSEITGLALVDLTADGLLDVAMGSKNGRLFVLANDGAGAFTSLVISGAAELAGGGPMTVADMTGDGRLDLIVTSDAEQGSATTPNPDQAFVRIVEAIGDSGTFVVETLGGAASLSRKRGAQRPVLADMDGNGQPDIVLFHGTSDRVSVTRNGVGGFEAFGDGKAGKGGVTPRMKGIGFPRIGNVITLELSDAVGGTQAGLVIGLDRAPMAPITHVASPVWDLLFVVPTGGTAGAIGAGTASFPTPIPDDPNLPLLLESFGVEITAQWLVLDDDAGPPAPSKYAASNGLAIGVLP